MHETCAGVLNVKNKGKSANPFTSKHRLESVEKMKVRDWEMFEKFFLQLKILKF